MSNRATISQLIRLSWIDCICRLGTLILAISPAAIYCTRVPRNALLVCCDKLRLKSRTRFPRGSFALGGAPGTGHTAPVRSPTPTGERVRWWSLRRESPPYVGPRRRRRLLSETQLRCQAHHPIRRRQLLPQQRGEARVGDRDATQFLRDARAQLRIAAIVREQRQGLRLEPVRAEASDDLSPGSFFARA